METIQVRAEFHTAHRQLGYPGKCRHLHGHTWRGEITITCKRFARDDCDMSLEFGLLKRIMKDLDHKIIVTADDPELLDAERFEQEGVVLIDGRGPSVENVAWYVHGKVIELIRSTWPDLGLRYDIRVTIDETTNNTFIVQAEAVI